MHQMEDELETVALFVQELDFPRGNKTVFPYS